MTKRLLEVDDSQNDEYDEEIRQFYGEKYNIPTSAFSYIINVDDDDEEDGSSPPPLKKRRIEKENSNFSYYRNGDVSMKCIDNEEEITVNFSLNDLSIYLSKRGIQCEFTPIDEEADDSLTEELTEEF